jgi:hypothetical protein
VQSLTNFCVKYGGGKKCNNNKNTSHNPKKAQSPHTVKYLENWMMSPEHVDHPYPTEYEKLCIMNAMGIVLKQLTNWFENNRKRYWKPKLITVVDQHHHQQQQFPT